MGVPKQAMEQLEAAEKAMEQAQRKQSERNHPPVPATQDSSPVTTQGKPNAEPAPVSQQADTFDEIEKLKADLAKEHQLRRSLEGRLQSQLKPANEEVRRLRQELEDTQERIRQMEVQNKKPGAERLLTEEEKAELGDVLDVNSRMVRGILEEELESGATISALVESIIQKSLANRTAEPSAKGPSSDFWPMVDAYSPGARQINASSDARWLRFLGEYNTLNGQSNRSIAEQAMMDNDPLALADLFEQFKQQYGITINPSVQNQSSIKPERAGANQVVERRTNRVEPWTRAEVIAFYTDVSKGKFRGRESERIRYEAELDAAIDAGLIIG